MFTYNKLTNPILWTKTSEAIFKLILSQLHQGDRILEIGSGTGHISYLIAKKGFQVTLNDIRSECVEESKLIFRKHNIPCKTFSGSLYDVNHKYSYIWNSGLIQCVTGKERTRMIKKLSSIGERVLLIYPDVNDPLKVKGQNSKRIPGVDDAMEYSIDDVPELFSKHFSKTTLGELSAREIGLPYKMYWLYGENLS